MTRREAAEAERAHPYNWKFGFLYKCPEDPRIVVRNRRRLGWTWNFGHPRTYLYMIIVSVLFVAPTIVGHALLGRATPVITVISIAGAVAWAYHVASGPHD
ncbi:MAG: hypothetical protein K0U93_29965 [Gammaproteobacteria bacterium]|nr:hypothetical protein [Gammaproteobacteria bacterium]